MLSLLRDDKYRVIQHHMERHLGRHFALRASLEAGAPSLIECPIDYHENEKLTQALGEVICRS